MKAYLEPEEINLMEGACANLRDRLLMRLLFHMRLPDLRSPRYNRGRY